MELENKIALVTGGANGIGFAYASELLRNGVATTDCVDLFTLHAFHVCTPLQQAKNLVCTLNPESVGQSSPGAIDSLISGPQHVAILDLKNANGEKAANKLNEEFGQGKAIFVVCDVSVPQELEAGFAKTVEEFGGLDIVINNAGIMDDSRWELMVQINFNGVVRGVLLGLQYMGKDRGGKGGTIVNISSLGGIIPVFFVPIYCATKHAVVGLSRSFAQPYHYERTGVRILTLCPTLTDTQLIRESAGRTLDIVDSESLKTALAAYPYQTTDSVARCMVQILRTGENGSVWGSEGGAPAYEFFQPDAPIKKN